MTDAHNLLPSLPDHAVPAGTKGRILSAALVAFATDGFAGTSIRTIADAAHINSATLYSHFPSKGHILAKLIEIGSRELLSRITIALSSAHSSSARLDAIVAADVLAHAEYPLLALVTNREVRVLGPDLADLATAPTREAAALLRRILADGVEDTSFNLVSPAITAHVLEGMVQQIPLWLDPRTDTPSDLARHYVAIARRIVTPPPSTEGLPDEH